MSRVSKPSLPQTGGSFLRAPDGVLTRADDAAETDEPNTPDTPAADTRGRKKPASKEA